MVQARSGGRARSRRRIWTLTPRPICTLRSSKFFPESDDVNMNHHQCAVFGQPQLATQVTRKSSVNLLSDTSHKSMLVGRGGGKFLLRASARCSVSRPFRASQDLSFQQPYPPKLRCKGIIHNKSKRCTPEAFGIRRFYKFAGLLKVGVICF